jgi:hypothetical protein
MRSSVEIQGSVAFWNEKNGEICLVVVGGYVLTVGLNFTLGFT